jgi:hypothetical protein
MLMVWVQLMKACFGIKKLNTHRCKVKVFEGHVSPELPLGL